MKMIRLICFSSFYYGSDPYFFDALSSDEKVMQIPLNFDTLLIIPNPNWTGNSEIDGIVYMLTDIQIQLNLYYRYYKQIQGF